ncbi:histidinol-phosphate transaminase [Myxococcota bacterium]|nr:histidinol-phosphate transaminase [Myxococcota bacterium]MBU1430859.1 histidinol-phosphate transaminase [Myxococcota bacterium]MBU1899340.1 histidinol-phosphate transaminase [Myxococcota bacterium]
MRALIRDAVEGLRPYQTGKPIEELERELGITDIIKLASNENPLGSSPKALDALREKLNTLHLYPDGAAFTFRTALAESLGVGFDEVVVGNGSNELLMLIARTFIRPGEAGLIPAYAFAVYPIALATVGAPFQVIPTLPNYVTDLDGMLEAIRPETKLVYLAHPNNPTGTHLPGEALRRFVGEAPEGVIIVLDEAYSEYADAPDYINAMSLRGLRERLIITRTFSKCYGLAGARVGYAVGPVEMMGYLHRVRDPFNCNLVAQVMATAALSDHEFLARSVAHNARVGRRFMSLLDDMADLGVTYTPSQTNFILVETPFEAGVVYDALLRRGVIVRPMGGYQIPRGLRITIGTEAEIERCVLALRASLEALSA